MTSALEGGVLIENVTPGQPAAKAGMLQNDVITSVNGTVTKSKV